MKNGYVAAYRSAGDLSAGIEWVLTKADSSQLSAEAVKKVHHNYSDQQVAIKYTEVYQQAIAQKHFKL